MKKLYVSFVCLCFSFLAFSQNGINVSLVEEGLVLGLDHQPIGVFKIVSDHPVRIDECRIDFFGGYDKILHMYLEVDGDPYLSHGQEFLSNPYVQFPTYILNLYGDSVVEFSYFTDLENLTPVNFDFTCLVTDYHDQGNQIWTDPVTTAAPLSYDAANPISDLRIIRHYNDIFVSSEVSFEIYNLLGDRVFLSSGGDRIRLDLRERGIYFAVTKDEIRRFQY